MTRKFQSNIFPWDVVTADEFIKEMKPADEIVSVILANCGDTIIYLWTDMKLEVGSSIPISVDQTAYLSLSRVPVHFDTTGTDPKLVVLAERITPIVGKDE